MRREQAKSLLDQVVSAARGEEIEVILGGGTEALTRFANNEITQNVAERRYLLSVRVVQGKRTGRATGNDLSRAGIERLIERASDATRLQPEIADLLPLPGPQEYRAVDALDLETESLGAEVRAREVGRAVDRCRKAGLEGAGIYEVRAGTIGDYGEIGALLVQEGRSFLSGKIGKKVMGENITLRDDPFHPLQRGSPFDAEGMPTRPTTIIERGIAKSAVYDRQTAAKEGRESTGHGLPVPNTYGPMARHLVLEGGGGTVDDLVRKVDRGLLVTRVWYTNVVDPKTVTLTGMTRDGLFAIEGGKVTHAVRNFRFNQSVIQMLCDVEAMSRPERSGGVVCPGLLVRDFHMSSATEF